MRRSINQPPSLIVWRPISGNLVSCALSSNSTSAILICEDQNLCRFICRPRYPQVPSRPWIWSRQSVSNRPVQCSGDPGHVSPSLCLVLIWSYSAKNIFLITTDFQSASACPFAWAHFHAPFDTSRFTSITSCPTMLFQTWALNPTVRQLAISAEIFHRKRLDIPETGLRPPDHLPLFRCQGFLRNTWFSVQLLTTTKSPLLLQNKYPEILLWRLPSRKTLFITLIVQGQPTLKQQRFSGEVPVNTTCKLQAILLSHQPFPPVRFPKPALLLDPKTCQTRHRLLVTARRSCHLPGGNSLLQTSSLR